MLDRLISRNPNLAIDIIGTLRINTSKYNSYNCQLIFQIIIFDTDSNLNATYNYRENLKLMKRSHNPNLTLIVN